jgi:LuxR family transcriptional regulator, maltose regulon positive regulatory protein
LYIIEIFILQALALHEQGNPELAMLSLERALLLAGPEGYVRIFVDEGGRMRELLRQAVRRGASVNYARQLINILDASIKPKLLKRPAAPGAPLAPLGDALTRREVEILKLLASGHSVPEIAGELCIATSTLRTHIRNIYDKLGVHSRIEAVALSREMQLN